MGGNSGNRRGRAGRAVPLAAAALLLGIAGSAGPPAQSPSELVLDPGLLARLQTLADGLFNEIVLCLDGYVEGDTAYAVSFSMPTPRESTPMRSSFDPCDDETLASWHNHPTGRRGASPATMAAAGHGDRSRRLCVLSGTDIATAARLRYPFVVVAVDGGTWCWWTLSEVDGFAAASIAPGPPAPERLAERTSAPSWSSPDRTETDGG